MRQLASTRSWTISLGLALGLGGLLLPAVTRADWTTNRGNPNHTGNVDGQPGPTQPKVRWIYKAPEHFLASPVPAGKALYASGIGAFTSAQFHALALDADAADRMLWSKSAPFIKLPTVSSPAVAEGLMVFGDGMHQTDGATLYCFKADTGRPMWQFPVPGKLVHLEGAPTIDNSKVYIGGGDAGVLCVDLKNVTLEGKALDLAGLEQAVEKKWAELQTKFEADKAKNGDLALPPDEDALPKAQPKLLWQQGKGKLHVDAAVDVVGDKVLAASAFIDADNVGKRVLVCLKADDGTPIWEAPLKFNPWAGPTVSNDLVLVGCSSIRFDKKDIPNAKGEIVALGLEKGDIRWRRDVPGGVLGPVAISDKFAVYTSTDGKVRCIDPTSGNPRWEYDAKNPFFAGAAIAGPYCYAADLKGVVHAIKLADGSKEWAFDLANDPAIGSPGMVFGSPVVHGGEIFLATNNLEGEQADAQCVVACLSDKAAGQKKGAAVVVDAQAKTITIPCRVAARKLPTLKEVYPLEVVACYPFPAGQKAHETAVVIDAKPSDVHKALEQLGLRPGTPGRGENAAASGPVVGIYLSLPGPTGSPRLVPMEKTMIDRRTGRALPPLKWHFTGSTLRQPNPDKPDKVYAADLTGTLISIFPVTDETVFQTNLTMKEEPLVKLDTNRNVLPEEGTVMELVIKVP